MVFSRGQIWLFQAGWLVVLYFCLAAHVHAREVDMPELKVFLDGEEAVLSPGPRLSGDRVLVPLKAFSALVGAEAKKLSSDGPLAVCREDLCIPLDTGDQQTVAVDGVLFAPLDAFGEPLGLSWSVESGVVNVSTSASAAQEGLGIGDRPPAFMLLDLYTGEPVSIEDYRGKRTAFYMWASW